MSAKKKPASRAMEEELLEDLRRRVADGRRDVEMFEARHLDPFNRLVWIGSIIEPAARIDVFNEVISALEGGVTTLENVKKYAEERARMLSRNGATRSTAPLENLLGAERLKMWCEVLDLATEIGK
jgi:hypothetical protein